jgi:hypothetical protein
MKFLLAHDMQMEFKAFVRNVKIQMNQNLYEDTSSIDEDQEIKVEIHETSNN